MIGWGGGRGRNSVGSVGANVSIALRPIGFNDAKNFHHNGFSNLLPLASGFPCKSNTMDFAAEDNNADGVATDGFWPLESLPSPLWLLIRVSDLPPAKSSFPPSPFSRKISSVTEYPSHMMSSSMKQHMVTAPSDSSKRARASGTGSKQGHFLSFETSGAGPVSVVPSVDDDWM